MIRTISAGVLCFVVAAAGVTAVQALDAEKVAMERKVRKLGEGIGKSYTCTDAKGHDMFEQEAHHLFDLIVQDVGSDLAYVYALSVGRGSAQPKSALDCPKLLKSWEQVREDYELKGGK